LAQQNRAASKRVKCVVPVLDWIVHKNTPEFDLINYTIQLCAFLLFRQKYTQACTFEGRIETIKQEGGTSEMLRHLFC